MQLSMSAIVDRLASDVGYDEIERLFSECEAELMLSEHQATFGDDINMFLENYLNKTDDAIPVLKMISILENENLHEVLVKRITAKGVISRVKDRKTRARLATQTTGLNKATRRRIARKAAKTKRANPSGKARAMRKRKRAMARRKSMGW